LDIQKILADLRSERDNLVRAIEALVGIESRQTARKGRGSAKPGPGKKRRRGGLTPEGRRRLSEAMKRRWAERRKKAK
jgi:hypothetical protein